MNSDLWDKADIIGALIVIGLAVLALQCANAYVFPWLTDGGYFIFKLIPVLLGAYLIYKGLKWLAWILYWRNVRIKKTALLVERCKENLLAEAQAFGIKTIKSADAEEFIGQVNFRATHLKALAKTGHHKDFRNKDSVKLQANKIKASGSSFYKFKDYLQRLEKSVFKIMRPAMKMSTAPTWIEKVF